MKAKEFYEYQLNDKTSVVGRQDKDEIIMLMEEYAEQEAKNFAKWLLPFIKDEGFADLWNKFELI
jgi:GGDEF domain-containing protein